MADSLISVDPGVMLGKSVIRGTRDDFDQQLKSLPTLEFLADESCDFGVVRALRAMTTIHRRCRGRPRRVR